MSDMLRIWRSPRSAFGRELAAPDDLQIESATADKAYDDAALAEIAAMGFNAIWVHGLLRDVVPSRVFREFGRHASRHINAMRRLIDRAAKHGITVLLYMQPPRGLPDDDPFFARHPEAGGFAMDRRSDDDHPVVTRTVCTSDESVKAFLRDSSRRLFEELPKLGGVILITASEYPSHCWGKRWLRSPGPLPCPRCAERHPTDVVNEIIQLVRDGIRSVSRTAHIIAWNWSWRMYEKDPSPTIIRRLPRDVTLLAGFERGAQKVIYGKRRKIDEYALSYVGPSPRFRRAAEEARRRGLRVMAKLQIGTTHELATVPSLPLIGRLYGKARRMREIRGGSIEGFMGTWSFGNMVSLNTLAFNEFMTADPLPPKRTALRRLAEQHLPGCDAARVLDAWQCFADAMGDYPFCVPFLYASPVNYALAYPLKPAPVRPGRATRSWLEDRWTDDLSHSLGCYTLNEVIGGLGRLSRGWKHGTDLLARALRDCDAPMAQSELGNVQVCGHVWRSAWNIYRCYRLRRNWSDAKRPAFDRIARNEIANLEAVVPLLRADPRVGYHVEPDAQFFTAATVARKLRALRQG